ncbi:hypothetical protein B0H16DRAFT_1728770 [Mycena metata]|uniref:Uncharacterized protein n=1 Tax=Mycena metata TaxID=1033252 RepID=A0AAD7IGA2_9AGAR|nr:hypothetical protein B0H16DRAFT_1728770 [Mycena metata]
MLRAVALKAHSGCTLSGQDVSALVVGEGGKISAIDSTANHARRDDAANERSEDSDAAHLPIVHPPRASLRSNVSSAHRLAHGLRRIEVLVCFLYTSAPHWAARTLHSTPSTFLLPHRSDTARTLLLTPASPVLNATAHCVVDQRTCVGASGCLCRADAHVVCSYFLINLIFHPSPSTNHTVLTHVGTRHRLHETTPTPMWGMQAESIATVFVLP